MMGGGGAYKSKGLACKIRW